MNIHLVLLYSDGLKKFFKGCNSLQNKRTHRKVTVILDNVSAILKMLKNDNLCTYQMIWKELNIGSVAIRKIILEELHIKKIVCHWFPHNLTEHQKEERVKISKETLK